jgi:hypothetical protein
LPPGREQHWIESRLLETGVLDYPLLRWLNVRTVAATAAFLVRLEHAGGRQDEF